jgi:hypothetical protein
MKPYTRCWIVSRRRCFLWPIRCPPVSLWVISTVMFQPMIHTHTYIYICICVCNKPVNLSINLALLSQPNIYIYIYSKTDANIIVGKKGDSYEVVGMIDVGDMVHTWRVCEVCVCARAVYFNLLLWLLLLCKLICICMVVVVIYADTCLLGNKHRKI